MERLGIGWLNARIRELVLSHAPAAGAHVTAIPGLELYRRESPREECSCYRPFIALTVQGRKESVVGREPYAYGANHCVVAGMDMPYESRIVGASREEPFLAVAIGLDRGLVAQLAAELPPQEKADRGVTAGFMVLEVDERLMAAFARLLELLDEPEAIGVLAPMLLREIHFRLLLGPLGPWLRWLCFHGGTGSRVSQAVAWLRTHYREPLQVEALARSVGMSTSNFFRNFKLATGYSPLRYQKIMRLYAAQQLMLAGTHDVSQAAYAVGYESPTQFIREYKRLFGAPPFRDVSRRLAALR